MQAINANSAERDGQERERPGTARELDVAVCELVLRLIIAQPPGDYDSHPQPPQSFLLGERLVPERAQRWFQRRRTRRISVAG